MAFSFDVLVLQRFQNPGNAKPLEGTNKAGPSKSAAAGNYIPAAFPRCGLIQVSESARDQS